MAAGRRRNLIQSLRERFSNNDNWFSQCGAEFQNNPSTITAQVCSTSKVWIGISSAKPRYADSYAVRFLTKIADSDCLKFRPTSNRMAIYSFAGVSYGALELRAYSCSGHLSARSSARLFICSFVGM